MINLRIGIDLGTSYSCVGVYRNNKVEIIPNEEGKLLTPSFVSINDDERLVGESGKIQSEINPGNTIFDIKKLLGNNKNTSNYEKRLPFKITTKNKKTKIAIMLKNSSKLFHPEQIASMILLKLKRNAETYLDRNVTEVVISVPACFNESQRQAIKTAGRIAGFDNISLINEPTAAAIAYTVNYPSAIHERNVLIFDMGGGTLDVSVVTICKNEIIVKGVFGDQNLGGEDFDQNILSYLLEELKTKYGKKYNDNKRILCTLLASCERAKCTLSSTIKTQIQIDGILEQTGFNIPLTREKFEEINFDLFARINKIVLQAILNSKIDKSNIQDVVLVGGSSRVPKIQNILQNHFSEKQLFKGLNADESIACGAAIQAYNLDNCGSELIRIKDITLFSLQMGIHGNILKQLLNDNKEIPFKLYGVFETSEDYQTQAAIPIYKNNGDRILYTIEKIPSKPIGKIKIGIKFEIDSDGILNITAVNHFEKINFEIKEPSDRLTETDIRYMIEDAEWYKRKEDELNNIALKKNDLEELCCKTKSFIKKKNSISEENKMEIFNYLNAVMDNLDALNSLEDINYRENEVKAFLSKKEIHT